MEWSNSKVSATGQTHTTKLSTFTLSLQYSKQFYHLALIKASVLAACFLLYPACLLAGLFLILIFIWIKNCSVRACLVRVSSDFHSNRRVRTEGIWYIQRKWAVPLGTEASPLGCVLQLVFSSARLADENTRSEERRVVRMLIISVRTILHLYVPSSGINPNHFIFIIIHQSSILMKIRANTYQTCTHRTIFDSNENQNKEQASEQGSSKQQEASSKDGSFNQSKVIEYIALLQGQSEDE